MKNSTICVLPWNHLSINSMGYVRVCCNSSDPNLFKFDPNKDFLNHSELVEIRSQMLQGKWPQKCDRCRNQEYIGVNSFRQMHNSMFSETVKEIKDDNFLKLEYLNLDLGTKCNAACIMCGDHSSSLWAKINNNNTYFPPTIPNVSYENMKKMYIIGGEPLIIDEFWDLIENIENQYAKNIEMNLNTNLSVIPKKINLLNKFKKVKINLSIDGTKEDFNFVRWPLTFSKIKKNYLIIKDFENFDIEIHSVLMNINLFNFHKLYDEFPNEKIFINLCDNPEDFQVSKSDIPKAEEYLSFLENNKYVELYNLLKNVKFVGEQQKTKELIKNIITKRKKYALL